jgi:hypothetical protein
MAACSTMSCCFYLLNYKHANMMPNKLHNIIVTPGTFKAPAPASTMIVSCAIIAPAVAVTILVVKPVPVMEYVTPIVSDTNIG